MAKRASCRTGASNAVQSSTDSCTAPHQGDIQVRIKPEYSNKIPTSTRVRITRYGYFAKRIRGSAGSDTQENQYPASAGKYPKSAGYPKKYLKRWSGIRRRDSHRTTPCMHAHLARTPCTHARLACTHKDLAHALHARTPSARPGKW